MRRLLILVGVLVVVASVYAQSARSTAPGTSDVEALARQVEVLESRVARLEAREGRQDPTFLDDRDTDRGSSEPTGRILRLDGIDTVEPEGTTGSEEVERLERDIVALENNVQRQTERLKSMTGQGRRGSSYRSGRSGYKRAGTHDKRSAQAEVIASYRKQLGEKKRELNRLTKQLTETKQIIHGHRGDTIITLHTTRDLSGSLGRVDIGGYLTWNGRKSSADADSEEWVVTSLAAADAP